MIKNIRKNFPWLEKNKRWIYFDNGATTLKPQCVLNAINDFYINYGTNPHNTDNLFSHETYKKIEQSRLTIATLFNCKKNNIAFSANATESLSMIINSITNFLKPTDEVILSDIEHTSNLVGWIHANKTKPFKIKYLSTDKLPTEKDYLNAITKNTKIISFLNASNLYGNLINWQKLTNDIKKINKDIIVMIDATQYLPHKKMDVTKTEVDFVCCSAHKMLGPMGIGCCYINDKWIEKIDPIRFGGGMNSDVSRTHFNYAKGMDKFEGGTLNCAGIYAWAQAIKYLDKLGWNNLLNHEKELKKYFVKRLKEIKEIEIYNEKTELAIIIFNYKNVFSQDLASYLGQKNFIVRSGLSCAKLANSILKTESIVRVSLYAYNTKTEIDKFIDTLKAFKKGDELTHLLV